MFGEPFINFENKKINSSSALYIVICKTIRCYSRLLNVWTIEVHFSNERTSVHFIVQCAPVIVEMFKKTNNDVFWDSMQ